MTKLNKTQQDYALRRVDTMLQKAINSLPSAKNETNRNVLIEKLEKAGFVVTDGYYLTRAVALKETAKEKQEKEKRAKKESEYRQIANLAKDQIMLGDSEEVTKILADLSKKLA